jgi:hypothetical protein
MPRRPTGRPNGRPKAPLDERMWRALKVELEAVDFSRAPWPSRAKATDVAKAAGVSHTAIQKRRRDCQLYRDGLFQLFREDLEKELDKPRAAEPDNRLAWEIEHQKFVGLWGQQSQSWRRAYMLRWVCQWAGWKEGSPITSPINGKVYDSQQAYADHLIEEGAIPWPHSVKL